MNRKFFGTDGVRGLANSFPMTPEIAMKVGMAAGRIFTRGEYRHRVVIGKDTRLSGYMVESALEGEPLALVLEIHKHRGPRVAGALAGIITRPVVNNKDVKAHGPDSPDDSRDGPRFVMRGDEDTYFRTQRQTP